MAVASFSSHPDNNTVDISSKLSVMPLNSYLFHTIDHEASWDIDQAMQQEFKPAFNKQHFGITESAIWFRFFVHNNSSEPISFFIELSNPTISHLRVYQLKPTPVVNELGMMVAFNKKPFGYRNPTVQVELAPDENLQIIVRAASTNALNLPFYLKGIDLLTNENMVVNKIFGLYYGAVFIILVLCIVMFFLQQESSYLYNLALLTCLHGALIPWMFGVNHAYIFPNTDNVGEYFTRFMQIGTLVAYTFFLNRLFHTAKFQLSRFYLPTVITVGVLFSIKLIIFGPSTLHVYILRPLLIIFIPVSLFIAWNNLRERSAAAFLYLLSWMGIFIIVFMWAIKSIGLIDVAAARVIILLGSLFQAVTLFAAMAYNVKAIQNGKLAAHQYIKKLDRILNHLQYGVLTVNSSLTIEPEFSAFLTRIYETDSTAIAGKNLLAFAFSRTGFANGQLESLQKTLRSVFDQPILFWEKQCHLLPEQINIDINGKDKVLSLAWAPILSGSSRVSQVMLTVDDLTEQFRIQHLGVLEKENQAKKVKIISDLIRQDRHQLQQYLNDSRKRLACLDLRKIAALEITSLLPDLQKITAGSLVVNATSITEIGYRAEKAYKDYLSNPESSLENLNKNIVELDEELQLYDLILNEYLGYKIDGFFGQITLTVLLARSIYDIFSEIHENSYTLRSVRCDDRVVNLQKDCIPDITNLVTHAVKHCVYYGYIHNPESKKSTKKIDLEISSYQEGGDVIISIADRGHWLEVEDVEKVARKEGWSLNAGEDKILDLLLLKILSDVKTGKPSAEAHQGLVVISDIANKLSGSLKIRKNKPEGAKLVIELSAATVLIRDNQLSNIRALVG